MPPRIGLHLLTGTALLAGLPLISLERAAQQVLTVAASGLWAVGVNAALAGLALATRSVTASGALAGLAVGALLLAVGGWPAWSLLAATFAVAATTTRFGRRRKIARGIAEDRHGARAAGNVIANTGVAAIAALLSLGASVPAPFLAVAAAALATSASDTAASEVGKAIGGPTYVLRTWRPAAAGATGAVSAAGTVAALLVAAGLGGLATLVGLVDSLVGGAVICGAATVASLSEGLMAESLETRGVLDNNGVNFVSSAFGATLAAAAASVGWL